MIFSDRQSFSLFYSIFPALRRRIRMTTRLIHRERSSQSGFSPIQLSWRRNGTQWMTWNSSTDLIHYFHIWPFTFTGKISKYLLEMWQRGNDGQILRSGNRCSVFWMDENEIGAEYSRRFYFQEATCIDIWGHSLLFSGVSPVSCWCFKRRFVSSAKW